MLQPIEGAGSGISQENPAEKAHRVQFEPNITELDPELLVLTKSVQSHHRSDATYSLSVVERTTSVCNSEAQIKGQPA
jgi:hypothetical protein